MRLREFIVYRGSVLFMLVNVVRVDHKHGSQHREVVQFEMLMGLLQVHCLCQSLSMSDSPSVWDKHLNSGLTYTTTAVLPNCSLQIIHLTVTTHTEVTVQLGRNIFNCAIMPLWQHAVSTCRQHTQAWHCNICCFTQLLYWHRKMLWMTTLSCYSASLFLLDQSRLTYTSCWNSHHRLSHASITQW